MKRPLILLLIFAALASPACAVSSILPGSNAGEAARPTSPFDGNEEVTPTPRSKAIDQLWDGFDASSASWTDPLTVTTQARPGRDSAQVSFQDGKAVFQLLANETYVYRFYRDAIGPDVIIETSVQASGQLNNGIALVCRVNADQTAWYEFRLSSTRVYAIYTYDASRRADGLNPYAQLKAGLIDTKVMDPSKENVIRAACTGSTLTLGANGVELASVDNGELVTGDQAGIGAISADVLPVSVSFDYVSFEKP